LTPAKIGGLVQRPSSRHAQKPPPTPTAKENPRRDDLRRGTVAPAAIGWPGLAPVLIAAGQPAWPATPTTNEYRDVEQHLGML